MASTQTRTRPDVRTLSSDQQELLSKAFQAMMDRKPDDPNSFTALASVHGAWVDESFPDHPDDLWCAHGGPKFPFWHRQYMLDFENALRSGGFDVTLPYWNIQEDTYTELPAIFSKPPFNGSTYVGSLRVPSAAGDPARQEGDRTHRMNYPGNPSNRRDLFDNARGNYDTIVNQTVSEVSLFGWGGSGPRRSPVGILEAGHNTVHTYVGGYADTGSEFGDMSDPTYAAFDPIFFFHHCNVDRLLEVWLEKQTQAVRDQVFMKWKAETNFPKYGSISLEVLQNKGITYGKSPVRNEISLMAVEPGAKSLGEPQQPKRVLVIHLKNVKTWTTVVSKRRGTSDVLGVSALFVTRNKAGCSNCVRKEGVDATFHLVDGTLKKEDIDCVVGVEGAAEVADWDFVNLHE